MFAARLHLLPDPVPVGPPAPSRARRVLGLVGAIALLGAADLLITLSYLRGGGLLEANPIVVQLVRGTGSAASVSCFKVLTLLVGLAPICRLRRFFQAELAAWTVLVVFAGVCVAWVMYAAEMSTVDPAILVDPTWRGPGWIRLD